MRPTCKPTLAAAAACALMLTYTPLAVAADPQGIQPTMDLASLYKQPPLDGAALAFAYSRMNGITPDFRPYAERSTTTRAATAFDRDAVITRETARLQAAFQNLDLARVYDVRLNAELRQYDATRGGYPFALGEDAFIPFQDQATAKSYGLQFRNTGDVNFIPAGDPAAARAFAQRTGLNTQGSLAGIVILQMAYRLVEAPPALDNGGPLMVRADILAARVLNSSTGAVIYDFGLTRAASRTSTDSVAAGRGVLKAADVQGLRLGMQQAEAEAVASRGWTAKKGSQQDGQILWFNDLQARQGNWAVCGSITNEFPSPIELDAGASPPSYKDCIGYGFARVGASNGSYGDRVGQVAAQQYLAGGEVTTLRRALEDKYGKPTYVRGGGSNLIWVGHDPAKPDADQVQIEARFGTETGQAGANRVILQVSMRPYVDPQRPKPALAQPAVSGGPRL